MMTQSLRRAIFVVPIVTWISGCSLLSSLIGKLPVPVPDAVGSALAKVDQAQQLVNQARSGNLAGALGAVAGALPLPPGLQGALSGNLGQMVAALAVPGAMLAIQAAIDVHKARKLQQEAEQQHNLQSVGLFFAGRCSQSEPADARAQQRVRKEAAGAKANDPQVLEAQAERAYAVGDYARAAQLLDKSVKLRGKKEDADLAAALNKLAAVYFTISNYAAAWPPAQRSLALRERLAGPTAPEVAESLNTLAGLEQATGNYPAALPLYTRARTIRQQSKALGPNHLCVAESLNDLGRLRQTMGQYGPAESPYKNALRIRTDRLGDQHRDVAQSMNNLASLYLKMSDYRQAEWFYKNALNIRERQLGSDHPDVAESHQNLGDLYQQRGDYAQASREYDSALKIRESRLPPGDPRIAQSVNALGELYARTGDYDRALPLYQRALGDRQRALGPHHPEVAESLDDLAQLYQAQGDYQKAEPLYQQALQIRQGLPTPNPLDVARSLNSLGGLYQARGEFAKAAPLFQQALEIRQQSLGADHPEVAQSLYKQAQLFQAQGEFQNALPLYQQALQIRVKKLGDHIDVAESLMGLGTLYVALSAPEQALPLFTRANTLAELLLRRVGADEAGLDGFLKVLRTQEEIVYSLLSDPLAGPKAGPEAARLAMTVTLLRKGRSVDKAAETTQLLYRSRQPKDREIFTERRRLVSEFATLSQANPPGPKDAQKLKDLKESIDQLNRKLAQSAAPQREQSAMLHDARGALSRLSLTRPEKMDDATYQNLVQATRERVETLEKGLVRPEIPGPDEIVGKVAAVLPRDGALLEIVAFHQYPFRPTEKGEQHYAALTLLPGGKPRAVDLGLAAPIDAQVNLLIQTVSTENGNYVKAAQELDRLVMGPVRPLLGKQKRLFLSLDGQLNLVPFAVLLHGRQSLIDRFQLTYLTSGRDLLRRSTEPSTTVALLANPTFLKNGTPVSGGADGATRGVKLVRGRAGVQTASDDSQSKLILKPLPGTKKEAEAIHQLLPQAEMFLGDFATKQAFLGLDSPGILHVATHGIFDDSTLSAAAGTRGVVLKRTRNSPRDSAPLLASASPSAATGPAAAAAPQNPLLSSKLFLAGAENALQGADIAGVEEGNGHATALEVASMNLSGTQLVVLSACNTGQGDVQRLGQGVYGLRRAVMAAGAETLVTSLWSVGDIVTFDLMKRYYKGLLRGQGREAAMTAAAKAVRKQHPHPFFWAPFIVVGQSARLAGMGDTHHHHRHGKEG